MLKDFMKTVGSSKSFADDDQQYVSRRSDPFLRLDGVGRLSENALDVQVLFD